MGENEMFMETLEVNLKWVLLIWVVLKQILGDKNESFGKI